MFAFLRFLIVGLIVCTFAYGALWIALRLRRKRLLTEDWEADQPRQSLDSYLQDGHRRYDRIRHRTLVICVYLLPICVVVAMIYLTNSQ